MERRTFVKGAVVAAGAAAAGAAGVAAWRAVVPRRASPGRYVGARAVGGPLPNGTPYLPLRLGEDGALRGVARLAGPGDEDLDVLAWFRYCGRADAPELRARQADETLRYHVPENHPDAPAPWWADRAGEPVRIADFPDADSGALATWRGGLVNVLKLRRESLRTFDGTDDRGGVAPTSSELDWLRAQFFVERANGFFMATSAACTHFCCTIGYRDASVARLAETRDASDKLLCACHFGIYEPREPAWYAMPEDGTLENEPET